MFVVPGTLPNLAQRVSHEAAERVAGNWWKLALNGLLLVVAGVLIFSIQWTVSSLATFLGVLFIAEGVFMALTTGFDDRVRRVNVITGLLSIVVGVAIIAWPGPGILAVAIFLGAWLIVVGTLTTSGAFATRHLISDWWMLLVTGILEVVLGVLALAQPGATLAAIIIVGGIWAVVVGVMRIVFSFELKQLPHKLDQALAQAAAGNGNGASQTHKPSPDRTVPAAS